MVKMVGIILMAVLTAGSQAVYASSLQSLQSDASALCQVYNPSAWREFARTHTRLEVYPEMGVRIRKAIKTPEFHRIFQDYLKHRGVDYYHYVERQVSHLIGHAWNCKDFDDFAAFSGWHVDTKADDEKSTGALIIIGIDKLGNYQVDNKPLADNKKQTLRQAIRISAGKSKSIRLRVYTDSGVSVAAMKKVLAVANDLQISDITLKGR